MYVGNEDYSQKLYYLQTTCVIIVMIHVWVQPYKKKILNALDGVILLIIVLVVNMNMYTFSFLSSVSSWLSVVLIILPLLLLCLIGIKKCVSHCYNKKRVMVKLINPVDLNDDDYKKDKNNDHETTTYQVCT